MQAEIYQIKIINYLSLNNLDTGSILRNNQIKSWRQYSAEMIESH